MFLFVFVCLLVCLFLFCLSVCLFVGLFVCLFVCLSHTLGYWKSSLTAISLGSCYPSRSVAVWGGVSKGVPKSFGPIALQCLLQEAVECTEDLRARRDSTATPQNCIGRVKRTSPQQSIISYAAACERHLVPRAAHVHTRYQPNFALLMRC